MITAIVLAPFLPAWGAPPASRSVTFYRDGALVSFETAAARGIAEITLPEGCQPDSLRIRPTGSALIRRVEQIPPRASSAYDRELEALGEQKQRLEDRLKALDAREQIFSASARAQSGKAPRRTKANPDPLQSLRQGTDFAIAQLEAVYTARRKTAREITLIEKRIAEHKNRNGVTGSGIVRVQLTSGTGSLSVRCALAGSGWIPRYDLALFDGKPARLTMFGQAPAGFGGYRQAFSAGILAEAPPAASVSRSGQLVEFVLAPDAARIEERPVGPVSLSLTNSTPSYLPPGTITLYRNREYLGDARFRGLSSGKRAVVTGAQ